MIKLSENTWAVTTAELEDDDDDDVTPTCKTEAAVCESVPHNRNVPSSPQEINPIAFC